jgi:hypothetical protein
LVVELTSLKSKKDESMQILNSSMLPLKLQKVGEGGLATVVLAILARCFSGIFVSAAPV